MTLIFSILSTLLLVYFVTLIRPEKEIVFEFKEYDNIESPKLVSFKPFSTLYKFQISLYWPYISCFVFVTKETAWREWEAACEQTPSCLGLSPLNKTKCVRKCMSPSCYHELYAFDEVSPEC